VPRFDQPDLLVPCAAACEAAGIVIGSRPPLPVCFEPDAPGVTEACDESMVEVGHPSIVTIPAYLLGGWVNARPDQWLRSEVHDRLCTAAESLPDGFGLAVLDAWRPLELQVELYAAATADPLVPPELIAAPSADPRTPPSHLTGGAVDCTLTIDGVPLALGTGFDDLTPLAHVSGIETTPGLERELRRLLYWTMREQGFVVFHAEWWHFEFGTRRWAAITGGVARYGPTAPPTSHPAGWDGAPDHEKRELESGA
jgi:D-alanyl-D-alanine dipeptidase